MSARDELAEVISLHNGAVAEPGTNRWHCNCGEFIHSGRKALASAALDAHTAAAILSAGYQHRPEPEIEWGTRTKWGSRAAINRENAVDYIQLCDLSQDWAVLIKREAAGQPGPWEDA